MKKNTKIITALICAILLAGCRNGQPANTVLSPSDAVGREIGVLYGTSSISFAAALGNTTVYYTTGELMDALKIGALDCVIMESGPAEALASKTAGVKTLDEPLFEYDLCFAIAKENADLNKAVNAALLTLEENGTLRGLREKHILGKNYTYTQPEPPAEPRGTLKLAVPADFPPYSYKNEDGEYQGFDIDVAGAVCSILGVDMEIIEVESKKLLTTVQFGKADFALGGMYDNEPDRELVVFSNGYTHFSQILIVRR